MIKHLDFNDSYHERCSK